MQSCLGVYIEKNLIKYAKVSKDRENIKIESFGTKFYEDKKQAIEQIIQETNSTKSAVAINAPDAQYDYFNYFALLNRNALKKSIDIDFDMLCGERGVDPSLLEKRYTFALNPNDVEQMKAINVSIPKIELEKPPFLKNQKEYHVMFIKAYKNYLNGKQLHSSADEIKKLKELLDDGTISTDEFNVLKQKILE